MQLGFVIDHDRCIGCHACTVACKAENDVPVGSFRTSVKYVERGTYPSVKRHFLVQRCNHCSDAPCVTICPVNALEKRPDGIVDIDRDACIGCKACMQACPYDALYLNEDLGAVEKCHFCAHRVEVGLEPARAVVCPVGAIIAGDLDDPTSRAGGIVAERTTEVRRPEQGTRPNVHYVGADDVAMRPGTATRPPTYIWTDRPPGGDEPWALSLPQAPDARVVLDMPRHVKWGWPVALYLVTKGIAAGAAMLAPFAGACGLDGAAADYGPEALALLFTLITCGLLVGDLARPWAFLRMLTRPNPKSWLVRGAVVLGAFQALVVAAFGLRLAGADGLADIVRWGGAAVGLGVAGYTAFLFAQCKGRDLWESRWVLPHLLAQAVLCGVVVLLPFGTPAWVPIPAGAPAVRAAAILAALVHGWIALTERHRRHETDNARQAAAALPHVRVGPFRAYRDGLVLTVPVTIVMLAVLPALAFVPALLGLLLWERAFVHAGQLPPLS